MKALFVGLGSIGQRHLINFKTVTEEDCEILAFRETGHNNVIADCVLESHGTLEDFYNLMSFRDLDEAMKESPDLVFVTNPSSKHLKTALSAARHECHIFIEKPLSHNLEDVDVLKRIVVEKNLVLMVGYQTRFHPCYGSVKRILAEKQFGEMISSHFEWGTYLPRHHPYEDYRKGYAAVKDLGGGVILGLSHELDMICSFWGQPARLFALGGKLSPLEMDAEDTVSVLMGFGESGNIPVTLIMSYAQTKEFRRFKIQLTHGTIFCDLIENDVRLYGDDGSLIQHDSYPNLDRNELFLNEMREFISSINENRKPIVSIDDGIETLRLATRVIEAINV